MKLSIRCARPFLRKYRSHLHASACILFGLTTPAVSQEQFAGKTIRIIVPTNSIASGYGLYGSLAANHLARFLPPDAKVVLSYMPGAGGLTSLNYLYGAAPKDGTAIGVVSQDLATHQALGKPGIRYDARRFNYIVRATSNVPVHMIWKSANVATLEQLKQKEVVTGAVGSTGAHVDFPKAMNALLGTKWKFIPGYPGGNDVRIAMERGEVQAAVSPATLFNDQLRPWLQAGTVKVAVQYADFRHPALPDVPHVVELAQSADARSVFKFMVAIATIGRAFAAPPGVPGPAVAALRKSFDAMLADATFKAEAAKRGADIHPMSGDELAAYIREVVATPADVVARTNAVLGTK